MTTPPPRAAWIRWAVLIALAGVIAALYPQLMDFGQEIYRFFA